MHTFRHLPSHFALGYFSATFPSLTTTWVPNCVGVGIWGPHTLAPICHCRELLCGHLLPSLRRSISVPPLLGTPSPESLPQMSILMFPRLPGSPDPLLACVPSFTTIPVTHSGDERPPSSSRPAFFLPSHYVLGSCCLRPVP